MSIRDVDGSGMVTAVRLMLSKSTSRSADGAVPSTTFWIVQRPAIEWAEGEFVEGGFARDVFKVWVYNRHGSPMSQSASSESKQNNGSVILTHDRVVVKSGILVKHSKNSRNTIFLLNVLGDSGVHRLVSTNAARRSVTNGRKKPAKLRCLAQIGAGHFGAGGRVV